MMSPRWTLTALALVSALLGASGCVKTTVDRTYPSYQGVLTLTNATWATTADGRLVLVSGAFQAEEGLSLEDIQYNFRNAYVLTPGFVEQLMED